MGFRVGVGSKLEPAVTCGTYRDRHERAAFTRARRGGECGGRERRRVREPQPLRAHLVRVIGLGLGLGLGSGLGLGLGLGSGSGSGLGLGF